MYRSIFLRNSFDETKNIPFDRNLMCVFFILFLQIFDDHYHFYHREISKRSVEPSHHHQTRLNNDERVRWSKQQHVKSRKKRDFLSYPTMMGKNRVFTTDPKWPQMWYLVSKLVILMPFLHVKWYVISINQYKVPTSTKSSSSLSCLPFFYGIRVITYVN